PLATGFSRQARLPPAARAPALARLAHSWEAQPVPHRMATCFSREAWLRVALGLVEPVRPALGARGPPERLAGRRPQLRLSAPCSARGASWPARSAPFSPPLRSSH